MIKIKIYLIILLLTMSAKAEFTYNEVTYDEVQKVFITYCSDCHNSSTPKMNWLDKDIAEKSKPVIFNRVFVKGDMPLVFKYFAPSSKQLLRDWLTQKERKDDIVKPGR